MNTYLPTEVTWDQGCEYLIPWGTKILNKSGNTSDFWTCSESIQKTRRNFRFDCSQVRKSDVFAEFTPIKSESQTCFRNWLPSSPKFQRDFGIDSDQVRKHVALPNFWMQELQNLQPCLGWLRSDSCRLYFTALLMYKILRMRGLPIWLLYSRSTSHMALQ